MGRRLGVLLAMLLAVALGWTGPAHADPLPLPGDTDVDYQLGGAWDDVPDHVGIVERDRTDPPLGGRYNICYVNGFQTQPNEKRFWRHHWSLVLQDGGRPVVDSAWGEWLLDLRTPAKRRALARVMGHWVKGCADDGYDAVEFDNLDSFTRSHHLLERRQAIGYARLLVRRAHRNGLAAGQKNLAGFDGTTIGFDFAVAEECGRWDECDRYAAAYGDQVIAVEYRKKDFHATCRAYGDQWPVERRNLALTPGGVHAWC